jgi:AraC family transcriptional regulator
MANTNLSAITSARGPFAVDHRRNLPANIVEDELSWRSLPRSAPPSINPMVVATRWRSFDQGICEASAENPVDYHLVAIVLRREDVRISLFGRTVHDGIAMPGMFHVTGPGTVVHCVFRGPYDVLHLHVPNALITELAGDATGAGTPLRTEPALTQDPLGERLARALLAAEDLGGSFGRLYADCVSTAIVARLLGSSRSSASRRAKVAELARWRLKRVVDYVEASLADPVSLADLAAAAGLTRMHFAAQFRAATGLPPHEYLTRRRIERAQEMLLEDDLPLVDVALSVGFQTQSHFTSVFKRFVGQSPRAWRLSGSSGLANSCRDGSETTIASIRSPRRPPLYEGSTTT